jgi:hypothetical protein
LAGCVSSPSHEGIEATAQPSLFPTSTVILTSTEAHTATTTPTPTFTPIPRQPINTPSEKEKDKIALELLETNNGCELPCWWGIIPNKTRWSDAQVFLKPFSTIYERQPPNEWDVYEVHTPLPIEFSDVYAVRAVFAAKEGVVREIEIGYFDEKTYHLSSFLQEYGAPTEILISTYSADYAYPKNQVPLSVNLYYPEKGINVLYDTRATVNGSQVYGCLEDSPILFLWSPDEHTRSIDYIIGWDKRQVPYLRVEQAIGLDIQEFYQKYVNPGTRCLETPTNLWQSQ